MNVLVSHHCLLDEVRDGDPRLVQVRVGGQSRAALIVDVFLRLHAPVDRTLTISDDVSLVSLHAAGPNRSLQCHSDSPLVPWAC